MKEKPIIFTAPMVRAILEGRKTQTRRIVRFDTPCKYSEGDILLINDSDLRIEVISAPVQERLQDISEDDAIAEGCESQIVGYGWNKYIPNSHDDVRRLTMISAEMSYGILWQSLYGHDSWDKNPWVWVIEFKKLENK